MKKHLSKILILVIFVGLWKVYFSQPSKKSPKAEDQESVVVESNESNQAEMQDPNEIMQADYEKIVKHLKKENISDATWEDVSDFRVKFEDEITKENAHSFLKTAQNNIPDLKNCLDVDFCGMTPSKDGAYFDDQGTPAHQLVRRLLKIVDVSLERNPELITELNVDMLRDIANSQHKMLQPEAIALLSKYVDQDSVETMVETASKYTGESKANALVSITNRDSGENKESVINEISNTFLNADSDTVISVLEKMPEMKLTQDEKTQALTKLCRFKESDEAHNWMMIKAMAKKIDSDFLNKCN